MKIKVVSGRFSTKEVNELESDIDRLVKVGTVEIKTTSTGFHVPTQQTFTFARRAYAIALTNGSYDYNEDFAAAYTVSKNQGLHVLEVWV